MQLVALIIFCNDSFLICRTYRYAAYRQFTWWIHNKLGRHVRRIIPSCSVLRIRQEFPEIDGAYTCFKGTDQIASEIVDAMTWVRVDEDNGSDNN